MTEELTLFDKYSEPFGRIKNRRLRSDQLQMNLEQMLQERGIESLSFSNTLNEDNWRTFEIDLKFEHIEFKLFHHFDDSENYDDNHWGLCYKDPSDVLVYWPVQPPEFIDTFGPYTPISDPSIDPHFPTRGVYTNLDSLLSQIVRLL